ncbi:DUF262 domain-containing protein [Sphingomonas xinjiangensis]|uniref:GmrSD restriction endonucleases N-terminal domain-containing protein n=1 Tax=Sphingomonas xinjiangensis TaxID=643568 RepID=A0A840YSR0_9SPHN|nr:DUF262 domain-containing protein [Sphingomonas xinjiangensis]MBB5712729.1 hypothetical protein [Sphingomonas xinjiangensis]
MSGNEGEDIGPDVALQYGEITEDDLGLVADDIQQLVVAPTDWTISVLVDLLRKRKIDLQPNYQRRVAWDEPKMSRFIESLFMRLPVPQIVLAEMRPGVFAVIDGKQRINSLARFCLDDQAPLRLSGCEYRADLNVKTYDDLQVDPAMEPSVDAFQNHTVRTVVIKNWKSDSLLYLLFLRLNQNSVTLSPQELRRALYPGKFMDWLDDKTAQSAAMASVFKKVPDFRMRDMEVATRALGFKRFADLYAGNMKKFLNDTSKRLSENFDDQLGQLEDDWMQFEGGMSLASDIFGDNAFKSRQDGKYQRSPNRAVIDIMAYYFADPAVRAAIHDNERVAIRTAFENLCDRNAKFLQALQTSTKTTKATSQRFHDWGDALRDIIGGVVVEFPLARNS